MLETGAVDGVLRRVGASLLVRGWLSANSVVFLDTGADTARVVDTGYVTHAAQTVALVRHAIGRRRLTAIVNTHLHSDHCGGNASLQREWPGAKISVPSGYRDAVLPWREDKLSYRHTGQRCEPFIPDQFLEPMTELRLGSKSWQIHAAPGHDPDAVLLFEPDEGILISGDALWEHRLAIIFPELTGAPGFEATYQVLDMIEGLNPRLVLPGHGLAFTDVSGAIRQSRHRLDAFAKSPARHRRHAVRALVVYHMLEVQRQVREELVTWIAQTPIFGEALQCADDSARARHLADETVSTLVADGILIASESTLAIATNH